MRKSAVAIALAGIASVAMQAGSAFAQSVSARGLTADATVTGYYDDNAFRRSVNKESDFRIVPTLTARYDLPLGGQGLFVDGQVGYNLYMKNTRFNREWWNAGAGVNWALGGRCSGLAAVRYSERQSDFGDLGVALDNVEKQQTYSLDASCAGPAGIGLVAGISRQVTDNSLFVRDIGNLRATTYYGGLLYRSILLGDVTLRYMRDDRTFPNRFIFTGAGFERDGVKVDRVALAVSRPIGARLQGSAGLSYIWSKPDISIYDEFKGVGWNAALTYLVGPKLTLGISASRDASSSAAIDSTYQLVRAYGLDATYKFSNAISMSAGASDTRRSYKGQQVNPFFPLPLRGTETTRNYFASVNYAPTTRWSVTAGYSHNRRTSDVSVYDYSSNVVSLGATVRY